MKSLWICFVLFLAVVGYIASRPPDDSEQRQRGREAARENNADEDVKTVPVIARGVSVVPGAIVCPDFPSLNLMFSLYTESWSDSFQNKITNGLSSAVDGPPIAPPNFALYGCALLPIGTPMRQKNMGSLVPGLRVVMAKLPNGKMISGVTLPSMIEIPPEVRIRNAKQSQRYDEIMQPEIERHNAAIEQEANRHATVMRQLYSATGKESDVMDCVAADCQQESQRHTAAMQEENARFFSISNEAWKQVHPTSQ